MAAYLRAHKIIHVCSVRPHGFTSSSRLGIEGGENHSEMLALISVTSDHARKSLWVSKPLFTDQREKLKN